MLGGLALSTASLFFVGDNSGISRLGGFLWGKFAPVGRFFIGDNGFGVLFAIE